MKMLKKAFIEGFTEKWKNLSPRLQNALIGAGIGAIPGAGLGYLLAPEGSKTLSTIGGGLGGAGLGGALGASFGGVRPKVRDPEEAGYEAALKDYYGMGVGPLDLYFSSDWENWTKEQRDKAVNAWSHHSAYTGSGSYNNSNISRPMGNLFGQNFDNVGIFTK